MLQYYVPIRIHNLFKLYDKTARKTIIFIVLPISVSACVCVCTLARYNRILISSKNNTLNAHGRVAIFTTILCIVGIIDTQQKSELILITRPTNRLVKYFAVNFHKNIFIALSVHKCSCTYVYVGMYGDYGQKP